MRSNSEAAATRAAAVRAAADAAVASGSSVPPPADSRGPDPSDAPPFVDAHTLMRTVSLACDRFCAEGAAVAASKLLMTIDLTSGVCVCVCACVCVCVCVCACVCACVCVVIVFISTAISQMFATA
jgi:hypothetical protein